MKAEPILKQDAGVIGTVIGDGAHLVEDVFKVPEFATVKTELASKTYAVKNSELGRIASWALHAYEKGFDALTQNEKGTLVTLVRVELSKAHVDVTDSEIVSALTDAQ